ncbi:hypothetical protein PROFUN_13890 [Planoprotostelium fungivorum]|uniref:MCM C-terminal AAA(+) ATPase domain-containing protein n=1 Tax=Planoprotostelium fungivorum TaxID=1890364 RepID=A0A2P6N2B1_9EUKA|nr:hypothetical protein PROFUN_13890 [Planoprotostelium fungivorum]
MPIGSKRTATEDDNEPKKRQSKINKITLPNDGQLKEAISQATSLVEALMTAITKQQEEKEKINSSLKVIIVGDPGTGKTTLLNSLAVFRETTQKRLGGVLSRDYLREMSLTILERVTQIMAEGPFDIPEGITINDTPGWDPNFEVGEDFKKAITDVIRSEIARSNCVIYSSLRIPGNDALKKLIGWLPPDITVARIPVLVLAWHVVMKLALHIITAAAFGIPFKRTSSAPWPIDSLQLMTSSHLPLDHQLSFYQSLVTLSDRLFSISSIPNFIFQLPIHSLFQK